MKNQPVRRAFQLLYVIILGAIFVAAAASGALAQSGDVYNFYFQKAPGPTTVIQGGGRQTSDTVVKDGQVVTQAAPAPTGVAPEGQQPENQKLVAQAAAVASNPESYKKWELFGGLAQVNSLVGYLPLKFRGVNLGVHYKINKFVGLESVVFYAPEIRTTNESGEAALGGGGVKRENPFDFSAGLTITPITINAFGHEAIELGLVGGITTVSAPHETVSYYQNKIREVKKADAYFGVRAAVNFAPELGVVFEGRQLTADNNDMQGFAALAVRF